MRNLSDVPKFTSEEGAYPGLPGGFERAHASLWGPLRGHMLGALFGAGEQVRMGKDYEGDYQFDAAAQFDKGYRLLQQDIKHLGVKPIAIAFTRSMERVVSTIKFPIEFIWWASFNMRVICRAQANLGLPMVDGEPSTELAAEIRKVWEELYGGSFRGKNPKIPDNDSWQYGAIFLKATLHQVSLTNEKSNERDSMFDGLESILCSTLLASYAAYETALCDLWIELLNSDGQAAKNWAEKNGGKNITIAELMGEDFSLSGKLGSYLHLSRKVNFNSLSDARAAYAAAFKDATDAYFTPEEGMYEAEKVRHLLAHRGGLIDSKFKKEMKQFPEYAKQELGAYIEVSGPMVQRIVDALVKSAVALLKFGDGRLTTISSAASQL